MVSGIAQFFKQAHAIAQDARFIVQSIPNVDLDTVERVLYHLRSVRTVLSAIDDPHAPPEDINHLLEYVDSLIGPLDTFLSIPLPHSSHSPSTNEPNGPGRPRFRINLQRALDLHEMGNSWKEVALAMGVDRTTLYRHLWHAELPTGRTSYTALEDDELDEMVSEISKQHPMAGGRIMRAHLEARGVNVPYVRVLESLRRVDSAGAVLRWRGVIKRRVYRVRGSNALWHQDGNEKLRPWGFYVHGCVDGYSRMIIYLHCCNNKRSATVENLFLHAVGIFGWPSRVRGDFGTENNGIEVRMIIHWGRAHRAYLRGRSIHNVRIERLWRDVRRDTLEFFRQIFMHLEDVGLLIMESSIHRVCLFIVFQPRIQRSLDQTKASWNLHKIRTEGNRSPVALYELSKEKAKNAGYWAGDPGDLIEDVNEEYGADNADSDAPRPDEEGNAGGFDDLDMDEEIEAARRVLKDLDPLEEDGNFGIDVYCRAVVQAVNYFKALE